MARARDEPSLGRPRIRLLRSIGFSQSADVFNLGPSVFQPLFVVALGVAETSVIRSPVRRANAMVPSGLRSNPSAGTRLCLSRMAFIAAWKTGRNVSMIAAAVRSVAGPQEMFHGLCESLIGGCRRQGICPVVNPGRGRRGLDRQRIWLGAGAQPACRGVRSPAQRSECPNSGGPRSVIRDIVVGGCGCVVAVGSRPW